MFLTPSIVSPPEGRFAISVARSETWIVAALPVFALIASAISVSVPESISHVAIDYTPSSSA